MPLPEPTPPVIASSRRSRHSRSPSAALNAATVPSSLAANSFSPSRLGVMRLKIFPWPLPTLALHSRTSSTSSAKRASGVGGFTSSSPNQVPGFRRPASKPAQAVSSIAAQDTASARAGATLRLLSESSESCDCEFIVSLRVSLKHPSLWMRLGLSNETRFAFTSKAAPP